MNSSDIKIYISCFNNRVKIPNNPLLEIVQTGAVNASVRYDGVRYDDEGDNISHLNAQFNDASTIYWAWKNCDHDYYGFMQYRRFLSFNEEMLKKRLYEWPFATNDNDAFDKMHLTDEVSMRKLIQSYDVITCNYLQYATEGYSLYQQFCENHNEKDLVLLFSIIQEKYPEYIPASKESLFKNSKGYFANCFIMKKEYFHQYCQFMFDVLFEYYNRADMEDYNFSERRIPGFLSERILGIFMTYLEMETDCKIGYLQKCFFDTTREQPIECELSKEKLAIALSAKRDNLPECSATVQSIIDHLSSDETCDIVIFHEGITNYAIKRFCKAQIKDKVSIRFVNINSYFANRSFENMRYEKKQPYYNMAAIDMLRYYEKCIWVPTGSVVRRNILEIANYINENACIYVCQKNVGVKRVKSSKKAIKDNSLILETPQDSIIAINICKIFKNYANGLITQGDSWFERTLDYDCIKAFSEENIFAVQDFKAFVIKNHYELDRYKNDCALSRDFQVRDKIKDYKGYFTGGKDVKDILENFVEDISIPSCNIKPAFEENNVAIGVMFSEEYAKYGSVTIQSILENTSDEYNYDILVFHEGLSKSTKMKMNKMIANRKNASIRYCMIKEALKFITSDATQGAFLYTNLIYSRVLMGYLLPNYDQIITVDSDMIVDTDLSELYNYDFEDNFLAAAHEHGYDEGHMVHTLMLKDARKLTFNAGFMVINLKKFREEFLSNELLMMCCAQNWQYIDQDVLNILCFKSVKYLEYIWNYRVDYYINGTLDLVEIYWGDEFKLNQPKIYHYAGDAKPWGRSYSIPLFEKKAKEFDDLFWDYAVKSPFYREIMQGYADFVANKTVKTYAVPQTQISAMPQNLPNLIRVDHPIRIVLDVIMPKGSKRREDVKKLVRWWRAKKTHA